MLTSALSNVAPVVLRGFYSILNCVFDKPNSTLIALSATGGPTNSIDYFQYINADKFITQGGTSSDYVKGDGSLGLLPNTIVYTSGNQTISGVKTFSDLPFVNGTGVSISGHTHTFSDITNFSSGVLIGMYSGIVPLNSGLFVKTRIGGTLQSTTLSSNDIIDFNDTPIFALGNVSGSNAINFGADRLIQTLTLGGTSTTFTKGTGWPSSSVSRDIVLRITVTSATSITWTIVNDWFSQPPAGALSIGTHLFLLRAIGSSIIEGHYIGNKTN